MLSYNRILKSFADFILPRQCPACNNILIPEEDTVCACCIAKLKRVTDNEISYEYQRSFGGSSVSGFFPLYLFEKDKPLQHIIHSLKYRRRWQNAVWLGSRLGEGLTGLINDWNIQIIVPVPLHSVKKSERGFNQSYYIAKAVSGKTGIPMLDKGVSRIKYTDSQTGMNRSERNENVKDAFRVKHPERFKGMNVLLIDDVITTGATVRELAKTFSRMGSGKIYAASPALASL